MTIEEKIAEYLKNLPSGWKKSLTKLVCSIKGNQSEKTCEEFKECEIVTSLSPFTVNGTLVSIQYTDENSMVVTRSFDTRNIINNIMNQLDPNCLATQEDWLNMSPEEKLQTLIDEHCNCCV